LCPERFLRNRLGGVTNWFLLPWKLQGNSYRMH
jgi:hypothetical protein